MNIGPGPQTQRTELGQLYLSSCISIIYNLNLNIKPALADKTTELILLQSLLYEMGVPTLWCDNCGAAYLTANIVFHVQTKHVETDIY